MEAIFGLLGIILFLGIAYIIVMWILEHIVQILMGIVGIALSLYLIYTFFISLRAFFSNFKITKTEIITEPAFENYLNAHVFRDLKQTFLEAFNDTAYDDVLRIGSLLWLSIFSLCCVIVVLPFFILFHIFKMITYIVYKIFIKSAVCPTCHHKGEPIYECPTCGAEHKKLYPNEYGIFSHTCQCGEELSTFSKKDLVTKCNKCKTNLSKEFINTNKLFIPIIGAPSAGKTNFMFGVVRNLIEKYKFNKGYDVSFIDNNTQATYEKVIKDIQSGILPNKTIESNVKAFNLAFKKDNKTKWTLYLYDGAGEIYRSEDKINLQKYTKHSSGIVFIIDPFSINIVKEKYKNKLSKIGYNGSNQDSIDDILSRLIHSLEKILNLKKSEKYPKPLAVIINKIDELENEIINNNPDEARKQLEEWGQHRFLQMLDTKFKDVRFFGISALNTLKEIDETAMQPVEWILSNSNFK